MPGFRKKNILRVFYRVHVFRMFMESKVTYPWQTWAKRVLQKQTGLLFKMWLSQPTRPHIFGNKVLKLRLFLMFSFLFYFTRASCGSSAIACYRLLRPASWQQPTASTPRCLSSRPWWVLLFPLEVGFVRGTSPGCWIWLWHGFQTAHHTGHHVCVEGLVGYMGYTLLWTAIRS